MVSSPVKTAKFFAIAWEVWRVPEIPRSVLRAWFAGTHVALMFRVAAVDGYQGETEVMLLNTLPFTTEQFLRVFEHLLCCLLTVRRRRRSHWSLVI